MYRICDTCMHSLKTNGPALSCVKQHVFVDPCCTCRLWKQKVQYTGMYSHITDLTKDNNADRQKGV